MADVKADTSDGARWKLPRGRILRRHLKSESTHEYSVYVPTTGSYERPVLVAAHSYSRAWDTRAKIFAAFCEQHGLILVAPHFRTETFSDFQRLGRVGRGQRADVFLNGCLQEVASLTGADVSKIHLFGHSGGAQFAHRYMMAYPHRVSHAIIVSAGWYTFPDARVKYPYGASPSRKLPNVLFNPEEYLSVPLTVIVGDHDTGMTALRNSERLAKQQGGNRLERAKRWVSAMRTAAATHNIRPRMTYVEIPNIGHSFSDLCERGDLLKLMSIAIFGSVSEPVFGAPQGPGEGAHTRR